jgi:hypothetical protein
MKYRELTDYKYQTVEDYTTKIEVYPEKDLIFRFMELSSTGNLLIKSGYAWDGATGLPKTPTTILRGSLVHDVLYQLMRLGALDYKTNRILADRIFRSMCLEDGASKIEANCVYSFVRVFGEKYTKPTPTQEVVVLTAPKKIKMVDVAH